MTRRRFSERALAARLAEFGGCCAECGMTVGGPAGLEWDHVVPLELGGADEVANLQPLCRGCHCAKTASDVRAIRKAQRQERRQLGVKRTARVVIPGSRASQWKRKLDGTTVRREP